MPKALIFDLGAVLLEIDVVRAVEAFRLLTSHPEAFPPEQEILGNPIFRAFETGELDTPGFRAAIRKEFGITATDAQIDAAWNALLIAPFPGRVELLNKLSAHYPLYLLSNTNQIHYEAFMPMCDKLFAPFEQFIFSFEIGMRKPNKNIYQYTLDRIGLPAPDCLFIDDSAINLSGARELGLLTYHYQDEFDFLQRMNGLFKEIG